MPQERILVFIPAYNCERQITRVLEQFIPDKAALFSEIIVIDNHSTDKTVARAKEAAAKTPIPVTIIQNNQNYGLGGSIKKAFLYAIEHNFDYVVTLHGDDQAHIADLASQLRIGWHRGHDFFIGARFQPGSQLTGYSWLRRTGNIALNYLCCVITGRRIYDMIAGMNIYHVDYLRSLFFLPFPNDLTFDAHFLLYAAWKKADFDYFPIGWHATDQISNARVFRQGWIVLKLFAAYVFGDREELFAKNKSGFPPDFRYPGAVIYNNGVNQESRHTG